MPELREVPQTDVEMAQELATLVGHITAVTRGDAETEVIVDRMLEAGADEGVAAFDGLIYAWMLAVAPHLYGALSYEGGDNANTELRLGRHLKYRLPLRFRNVDREWADRPVISRRTLSLVGNHPTQLVRRSQGFDR